MADILTIHHMGHDVPPTQETTWGRPYPPLVLIMRMILNCQFGRGGSKPPCHFDTEKNAVVVPRPQERGMKKSDVFSRKKGLYNAQIFPKILQIL